MEKFLAHGGVGGGAGPQADAPRCGPAVPPRRVNPRGGAGPGIFVALPPCARTRAEDVTAC